ncbi:unnamed protein product [Symbiodinium microadriaticum]|nr:unnamed protein product [Symbiodinium microadriaticum]
MELPKAMVWLQLLSWTLALHVLYFGLCEKGARHVTRILHGPSFGGAHAMLLTYMFEQLTAPRQADEGIDSFWSVVWQFWLHCAPVLLHWADGMLNFKELQAAYSPPMTGGTTSIWDAGGLVPAMRFASSRSLLRAWSAAAGYFMLECAWSATTQVSRREFGVHKLLEVSSMEEVLRLAASLVAYSVFTHRLFTVPEAPAMSKQQKVARMRDGDLLTVAGARGGGFWESTAAHVGSFSRLPRGKGVEERFSAVEAFAADGSCKVDESEAAPNSAPLRREVELRCGVFVQRLNLVNIGHEVDSEEEQPQAETLCHGSHALALLVSLEELEAFFEKPVAFSAQGLSVSGCPSEHIAAATEERQREQISQAHHLKEAFCLYAMGHGQTESIMSPSAFGSPVQFLNLVTSFGGSCMGGLIVAEGFGGFSRSDQATDERRHPRPKFLNTRTRDTLLCGTADGMCARRQERFSVSRNKLTRGMNQRARSFGTTQLVDLMLECRGESQWDHPCDHELRQLYASEKEKRKIEPEIAPGTPCKDLSVSSIYEETSPQRSVDEQTEQAEQTPSPSPQVKVQAAAAGTTSEGIKQAQLLPERPSKPPPSRLRPPRPKPLQLACDESTFCRSPVANSPQKRPVSASLTSLPGREPADRERVSPGDVQSPPTPRLSAVLTAELFNGEDMDQISLWSRLEEGEETLCQPLPQTHVGNCSARSLSSVHEGDSLEISSLTAALDNSNADHDSFNHSRSSSPPHQKQQAVAASRTPPWPHGSPGDASTHMSELRRLRQEIESNHVASETCETSSQSQGPKPEEFKEDAQHSHEKPVQDSTTQTDETTTASAGEGEHLSKTADSPGEELSPAPGDEKSPGSDKGIPATCDVSVQKSMAYLAAELNALACKTVQRCMVPDHPLPLRDITNEMQDLPDKGLKSTETPRSAAKMDIANMRMQLEVQEQQRATAEQQLDECLSTYRMEQAKHTATKAALRESQREVLRLQSQVQFKETETQRLEMELQRCQSELGCVFAQAKQAQVQLKAQQAELAQVKLRLRSQNSNERLSRTRPLQRAGGPPAAEQEPKASSGSISQLTHDPVDNANVADVAESTLRRARLASEVSDALRKRRRELRREHAELEQERRQWRLDARNLRRSQAADAEATSLNDGTWFVRRVLASGCWDAMLDHLGERQLLAEYSPGEYRALQRALTSGSLHQVVELQHGMCTVKLLQTSMSYTRSGKSTGYSYKKLEMKLHVDGKCVYKEESKSSLLRAVPNATVWKVESDLLVLDSLKSTTPGFVLRESRGNKSLERKVYRVEMPVSFVRGSCKFTPFEQQKRPFLGHKQHDTSTLIFGVVDPESPYHAFERELRSQGLPVDEILTDFHFVDRDADGLVSVEDMRRLETYGSRGLGMELDVQNRAVLSAMAGAGRVATAEFQRFFEKIAEAECAENGTGIQRLGLLAGRACSSLVLGLKADAPGARRGKDWQQSLLHDIGERTFGRAACVSFFGVNHFGMASSDKDQQYRCAWDGGASTWLDYVRRVRLAFEKTRRRKRLARVPIPDAAQKAEELLVRMRRPYGMTMATWCQKVRESYRGLQRALKHARTDDGLAGSAAAGERLQSPTAMAASATSPSGRSTASQAARSPGTPTARRSRPVSDEGSSTTLLSPGQRRQSVETVTEPEAGDEIAQEHPAHDVAEEHPDGRARPQKKAKDAKKRKKDDDDSSSSGDDGWGLQLWNELEQDLPEVLPTEILRWLMLRRSSLTPQQRLNVLSSIGNSLRAEDVELGLRGAEDELRLQEHGPSSKGYGKKGSRASSFWVEQDGEWGLLAVAEEDQDEWLEGVHWLGSFNSLSEAYGVSSMDSAGHEHSAEEIYWAPEPEGGHTKWTLDTDGEHYTQDAMGVYWSWPAWEAASFMSTSLLPEQKELSDSYAAYEGKLRTFAESRSLMQAKGQSRGYYPLGGKGKKGAGKGKFGAKGRGRSYPGSSSAPSSPTFQSEALAVNVRHPSYTGCFICGDKSHAYQDCPRRGKGKGHGKPGKVFMVTDADNINTLPAEVLAVVESPNLEGYGVLDTGATESVASLESLDHIVRKRQDSCRGECCVQVVPGPSKNFCFGNGSTQQSESFVLLSQKLGGFTVSLGLFTIDSRGVALLIAIKTLEKLGAVIDCSRGVMIMKTIDDSLVVPLKRSAAGHLLLNMATQDWLEGGAKIHYLESTTASEELDVAHSLSDQAATASDPPVTTSAAASKGKGKGKKKPKVPWEEKYHASRTTGPDPRDPRCTGPPCNGSHQPQANANQAAYWTTCTCCGMRLSYTPVFGGHGIYQSSTARRDRFRIIPRFKWRLSANKHRTAKDRTIAMDAAERSCLKRLEKIRADKEKLAPRGARPKAGTTPFPQHPGEPSTAPPPKSLTPSGPVVDLEADERMPPHPSRERTQSGGATGEHRPDQEFSSTVGDLGCFMGQCVSSWRDRFGKLKGPLDGGNEEVGDNLQVDDAGMTIPAEGHLTFEEKKLMLSYIQEGHHEIEQLVAACGCVGERLDLVELTSDPQSWVTEWVTKLGGRAIRAGVANGCDLLRPAGREQLRRLREHRPRWVWASFDSPVAGLDDDGVEDTWWKAQSMRKRARRLFRHATIILSEFVKDGGNVVWDWPNGAQAWKFPEMARFWAEVPDHDEVVLHGSACTTSFSKAAASCIMKPTSENYSLAVEEVKVDSNILNTMTEAELERLTITLLKLHRRCGHPGRQAFLRTLKARGADERTLAVANQLKCPECLESTLKKPAPQVSLEKEEVLWNTLQMDAFVYKHGDQVHHFILFLDEASSFAVVADMVTHHVDVGANIDTEGVINALESAWIQYFGYPKKIRCDLEGAFRGRGLEEYAASRGIEILPVPAEHHESTGDVERNIGTLKLRMEKFLRGTETSSQRAAYAMVCAHNNGARVGGYAPCQWAFGRFTEGLDNLAALTAQGDPEHVMAQNLALRQQAERTYSVMRAKAKISRALNTRAVPSTVFPGDLVYYQRYKVPADRPAHELVDLPRMRTARWYGPGRVLATETRSLEEGGVRCMAINSVTERGIANANEEAVQIQPHGNVAEVEPGLFVVKVHKVWRHYHDNQLNLLFLLPLVLTKVFLPNLVSPKYHDNHLKPLHLLLLVLVKPRVSAALETTALP